MYVGKDFSDMDPEDIRDVGFEMAAQVVPTDPIQTVTFSLAVVDGLDASASSRIQAGGAVSGTKISSRITNILAGVRYRVAAVAVTLSGQNLSVWSHVTGVVKK